ncbi:hypothetical protein A2803_05270 [Candidatus Woesebacteria bacterium RIFCSPHIGHO2_01_FULL_44_21]|uniref:Methyltransferase type 11 domain-containing protein n=1 Tax=Candidatus Woesebacteria bacterium RIFCSPHIGHO2_01_FULL_44_21 TaxID=1802503 RepID=A0A1F7YW45_9BACT|nr:MAG: hypothetical protein A2803_05270 [Candidatus Woesebacteria bacterium RIFCSPHIGHO2_01_FULL_44_21]OGM69072.1 MAG: hypothetical protein A2897_04545 [Candidatus Woesebacteria bacterium RIFCSPLOWO2_01_FULL_44_24b]
MKLHLGSGKRFIPDFVHVDLATFPHIDYVQDIRKLTNFKTNSVTLIYACQVLEYFDREEIPEVLKEWKRVLKSKGILRLSVPNFEIICKLYQAGFRLDYFLGTLYGKWTVPNQTIYHKTTFDEQSLTAVLKTAGFKNIAKWDWRKTEHAAIDDYSQAYWPHMDKEKGILMNLNMQGTKP